MDTTKELFTKKTDDLVKKITLRKGNEEMNVYVERSGKMSDSRFGDISEEEFKLKIAGKLEIVSEENIDY